MKTDLPQVYITLRFIGDNLDPAEINAALPVTPWRAHRKDEKYYAGERSGWLVGQTGLWLLTTDKFVDSHHLGQHVAFLHALLLPAGDDNSRIMRVRDIMGRTQTRADISVFWHGHAGETAPEIPAVLWRIAFGLNTDIDTDFSTETDEAA